MTPWAPRYHQTLKPLTLSGAGEAGVTSQAKQSSRQDPVSGGPGGPSRGPPSPLAHSPSCRLLPGHVQTCWEG